MGRSQGWLRRVVATAALSAALALAPAGAAWAADGSASLTGGLPSPGDLVPTPLPSTIGDTVNQVGGVVKHTIDQVTDTVHNTQQQVGQTAQDLENTVTGTLSGATQDPTGTGGGLPPASPAPSGGSSSAPTGTTADHRSPGAHRATDGGTRDHHARTGVTGPGAGRLPADRSVGIAGRRLEHPRPASATLGRSLPDRLGRAALRAVRGIAFPLALAALVGAFLLIQKQIDRSDPKLAAAPVHGDEDYLRFT